MAHTAASTGAHEANRRAMREGKPIPCASEFAHVRRPIPARARARNLFDLLAKKMGEHGAVRWLEDMLNLPRHSTLYRLDDAGVLDFIDEAEQFLAGAQSIDFEYWQHLVEDHETDG